MSKNFTPGEIEITSVSLYHKKGVINITEHIQEMRIVESIFHPGIVSNITIWDTMNISSMLPILGSEKIVIEYNTPGRETARYDLVITSINEVEPSGNMRTKAFSINAITPELLFNKVEKVCKSYNTNISNIVKDIVSSYLRSKKNIDVQDTRGIQQIIIPDIRPFQAIDMLKGRSTSVTDKSSTYLFFENQNGYNYKTIENLMSQTNVGDRVFTNNSTINVDISVPIFRNILQWNMPEQFDLSKRLDTGGMLFETQKFDYKTLEYTKTYEKFDPSNFRNADGNMKDNDNTLLERNYGRTVGEHKWVAHDSIKPDTFMSEGAGSKAVGASLYAQNMMELLVFGDSELTAGQIIEAKIVENSTADAPPEENSQISGKYVVALVEHIIGPSGTVPRYISRIECVKGGLKDVRR